MPYHKRNKKCLIFGGQAGMMSFVCLIERWGKKGRTIWRFFRSSEDHEFLDYGEHGNNTKSIV